MKLPPGRPPAHSWRGLLFGLPGAAVIAAIVLATPAGEATRAAVAPAGEEVPGVDRVTAPGRNLARGLDVVLNGRGRDDSGMSRAVYLLIDPTPSVCRAGLAPELAAALHRHADRLADTSISVLRAGEMGAPRLVLSQDHAAVVAAVEQLLVEPDASYRSLCADLRELADRAASVEAVKDVLVISFDNIDVENEVERTGERLKRGGWRCSFIARETPLSDSYWAWRSPFSGGKPPPDSKLHGSDGPFVDFPFALLFQSSYPNEETPSGFAPWMTSRLAHLTGGTVFLHAPDDSSGHQCSNLGGCRFCAGDHRPAADSFLTQQLQRLAPPVGSRKEAGAQAARDPFFRLVASTWDNAAKDGLMRLTPPFRVRGNTLRIQPARAPRRLPFAGSRSFDSTADIARDTRRDCDKLIKTLAAGLERTKGSDGLPRYRANAEFFLLALQVTRFNLFHLERFSREVGSLLSGRTEREFEPPEIAPYQEDQFFKGVHWYDVTLCHGARALHRLYLPGDDRMSEEIDQLDSVLTQFQQRWAHSPYAVAASRLEIPIFYTSMGSFGRAPPRTRPTSTSQRVDTPPARPQRGSGGSVGRTGGGTTGGAMMRRVATLFLLTFAGLGAAAPAQDIAELVERMTVPGWDFGTYHELRKRRDPRCIPLLVRAAPTMDGRGQFYAVHILELFPADEATPAFTRLLDSGSAQLRFLAARWLHAQGHPGMASVMIAALADPTLPEDRKGPLLDRIRQGAPRELRPAIAAWLTPDATAGLADRVLRHLLQIQDAGSVASVERLLQHQDRATRLRAAAFLLRFGSRAASDELDRLLKADGDSRPSDWRLMRPYLQKLRRLPSRLQTHLVEQLEDSEKRAELMPLFEILKDHSVSAANRRLFALLEHDEELVRHDAFGVLDWHVRWKTPELIALLDVEDPLLRVKAADALRRDDDLTGLKVLIETAGKEGPVREEACRVLAACRVREAVLPLIEALGADQQPVREAASTGLEGLLWSLFPYRRFEVASTGYDAAKGPGPNAPAIATLRGWWERHQGEDW